MVHAGEGGAAGTVFDGSGARVSRREEEPRAGLCGQTHPLRGGAPELEEAVSASGQGDCTCKEAGPQNPEAKIGARGVFLGGSNACQERNRDQQVRASFQTLSCKKRTGKPGFFEMVIK